MAITSVMLGGVIVGQDAGSQAAANPSTSLSTADKRAVVEAASRELVQRYVFEAVAQKVSAMFAEKLKADAYVSINDAKTFAEKLTEDIQAVTRDKHIRVRFSVQPIPERADTQQQSAEEIEADKKEQAYLNYGVERVERLPMNIGYIDLRAFGTAALASETISAAMSTIANTDALIVDLRENGGGDPATVAWMTSYLVDERTHLNSFFYRDANKTEQFWTSDYVPGKKFGGKKPIFVLTAKRTFSGAEEFSYNMKSLKRGVIVGETTGGGAHPGDASRLTAHFTLFVPNGRPINPITKTNWEGVGVEPDVKVPAADALRTAQLLALKAMDRSKIDVARDAALHARIAELEKSATTK
jgi:C-terminal processing protease CtpA/Prc